ncbi:MAG: hypothetical protein ACLP50_27565 [Solirubrobacteraceae bacterium]
MRDIARRYGATAIAGKARLSRFAALSAIATAAVLATLASPAGATAAALPPTITSAFTPPVIGVGGTSAVSVTITNPNASAALSSVAFTDTLPAGLTVDNPPGESGACGASSVVTAAPGSQTISLSGGSLKAATACTVSVAVTAGQPEVFTNDTGPVSSSAGASSAGDTETLTVLAAPTVSVTLPTNNAKYKYGQVVRANYSCTQPGDAPGLQDCSAQDDLGNDINSGQPLDTKVPGSHSLSVAATSVDGLVTTDTINYTVLPDNTFTITKITPKTGGALGFELALPGAGKVAVRELAAGKVTVGELTLTVAAKRELKVTVVPTPAGTALLSGGTPVKVVLQVSYTPKGGVKRTLEHRGIALS